MTVHELVDHEMQTTQYLFEADVWGRQRGSIEVKQPATLWDHVKQELWRVWPRFLSKLTAMSSEMKDFLRVNEKVSKFDVRELFPKLQLEAPAYETVLHVVESCEEADDHV